MFSISSDAIEVGCMSNVAAEVSGKIRLPDVSAQYYGELFETKKKI